MNKGKTPTGECQKDRIYPGKKTNYPSRPVASVAIYRQP